MSEMVETPEAGRLEHMLVRTFATEFKPGDGRTVDVRIVPYGEVITHNDGLGDVPKGVAYREEWLPGVFAHQVNAAHRVFANFEHQTGVINIVGKGLTLREAADGFHGSFQLLNTPAGDTMLELMSGDQPAVDGVSLEARPVKNVKSATGVLQRAKANLYAIAFTRFSAYAGARVLALRDEDDPEQSTTFDEALLPVVIDPELVERCRRLGIALPESMKAHPAQDTPPDDGGTSEDGTRQSQAATDQEDLQ